MSKGRHRAPVDHHVAQAVVTTGIAASISTGSFLAVTSPAVASSTVTPQVPARVPTSLVPASATTPGPTHYTVLSGDTLGRVGAKLGVPWGVLYDVNRAVVGSDPNLIVPGEILTVPAVPGPAGRHAVTGQDVVDQARQYLGVPYMWGGSTPIGLDCSGLTQLVYSHFGVKLPHRAVTQSQMGRRVGSLAAAQPGDLLFFYAPVSHVGIYIGGGQMIAAPDTGDVVKVQAVFAAPTVIRRFV